MNKRVRILIVGLIIALIIALMGWVVFYTTRPADDVLLINCDGENSSHTASACDKMSSSQDSMPDNIAEVEREPSNIEPNGNPQTQPIHDRVNVRIVNSNGDSVVGIELRYALFCGVNDGQGENTDSTMRGDTYTSKTDVDGVAGFDLSALGLVYENETDSEVVYFGSLSPDWQVYGEVPSLTKEVVEFVAVRRGTISIWAMLEDGTPWVGRASLGNGENWYRNSIRFDSVGKIELSNIPFSSAIDVTFPSLILDVDWQRHQIQTEDLFSDCHITIVLKRNPNSTRGGIEIDLTQLGVVPEWVTILKEGSNSSWGDFIEGADGASAFLNGPVFSVPLPPGIYVVSISKPAWTSAPIKVVAGKYTKAVYRAYTPCSIEVIVKDENGDPLVGAVLLDNSGDYVGFTAPGGPPKGSVITDSQGRAKLINLAPGIHTPVVEAKGFEPHKFEVNLSDGESIVKGPIYLERATGKITVKLKGVQKGKSYTVMLLQPAGFPVEAKSNAGSDTVVFEALPSRTYVVAIVVGTGGDCGSEYADLAKNKNITVEIDVSGLKED